jgi:hypothetical protein
MAKLKNGHLAVDRYQKMHYSNNEMNEPFIHLNFREVLLLWEKILI